MSDFKPITFSEEYTQKYWDGSSNRFARYYTYLQRGFGLFNETKNYLLMLFGSYWTIKTADYWINFGVSDTWLVTGLGILAIIGVGFLLMAGRWDLFKLSKAREFATTQHGSVTQYNSYNMAVFNIALMEAIAKKLGVDVETIKEELKK
mgnify:CR=1 FL=1